MFHLNYESRIFGKMANNVLHINVYIHIGSAPLIAGRKTRGMPGCRLQAAKQGQIRRGVVHQPAGNAAGLAGNPSRQPAGYAASLAGHPICIYTTQIITAGDLLTIQKSLKRNQIKFITIKDDFHKYRYVLFSVILINPYH